MNKKQSDQIQTIKVDYLSRVEGEGGLFIKVDGKNVVDVALKIFEPPRFFEAFLRGRAFQEVPDITARICGICPIAYQMSACHALEDSYGVKVDGALRELRRLIYCAEWIESHVLHIYMLHAPDFLGFESGIAMAQEHPEHVKRGLALKKIGNELLTFLGGREIHPINVKVGGFYRVPTKAEFAELKEKLERARDMACETIEWVCSFTYPELERDYEFVSLVHPDEYPLNEGRIVSSKGLDIDIRDFDEHFEERHVSHSNALHSVLKERGEYFVGPMARYALNAEKLTPLASEYAKKAKLSRDCRNPFKSIIIRSIEVLFACEEALRIIENYKRPTKPAVEVKSQKATGYGCTEAPRGLLYHRYSSDSDGTIIDAQIVPPTSQNQMTIESDLRNYVEKHINRSVEDLTHECEQAIRNYDPCISCATHFLKLHIDEKQ